MRQVETQHIQQQDWMVGWALLSNRHIYLKLKKNIVCEVHIEKQK
jgi:hypothetical protein